MNFKSEPSCPISIPKKSNSPELIFKKSFSYVENYHQKYYYPKIVMARIRKRYAKMLLQGLRRKSTSRSLDSSLETIFPCRSDDVTLSDIRHRADQNDNLENLWEHDHHHCHDNFENYWIKADHFHHRNSENCQIRKYCSNDHISKNIGLDFSFKNDEKEISYQYRICDVAWRSVASSLALFESMEDCTSTSFNDGCWYDTECEMDDLDIFTESKSKECFMRSSSLRSLDSNLERNHKKCVRFADTLGLELESVKDLDTTYSPLVLPHSVIEDLRPGLEQAHKSEGTQHICICFAQPGEHFNFLERVRRDKVALESCTIGARDLTATGTVRVANLCHHKEVIVRYTLNGWMTYDDIIASYVQNPVEDTTDRFSFSIALPLGMSVGSQITFAVRYRALDLRETYWDNNCCQNYRLECYAKAVPIRDSDSAWMHFL